MEQEGKNEAFLRKYLLGELNEAEEQAFEEELLADEELSELLLAEEDELVDDYLTDDLSARERERFDSHFLVTPERRKKLKFGEALRRYDRINEDPASEDSREKGPSAKGTSAKKPAAKDPASNLPPAVFDPPPPVIIGPPSWWRGASLSPYMRMAAAAVIVFAVGLGSWRAYEYFRQPHVSKGMLALREAYPNQRPTESRITEWNYAPPPPVTRGPERDKLDYVALDRAKGLIQLEANEHPSAESYQDLGRLYLAERDFNKAIDQFEKALNLDEKNAQLHSDLGAALAEKGKAKSANDESTAGLDELTNSLEHLNRSLDLDSSLLEALFNRALVYQKMMLWRQAEADWRRYLEKDSVSQWAAEAKERLKEIESERGRTSRQVSVGIDDFLEVCGTGEDEKAWDIVRSNRDVISGNLIWEQLAASALKDSTAGLRDQARLKLLSMSREGKLESQRAGDPFVSELARFYSELTPRNIARVADAHSLIQLGRDRYFDANYEQAGDLFNRAVQRFDEAGDRWEEALARLRVVHCYLQTGRANESLSILALLVQLCEKRSYLWLLAHIYNSNARAQTVLSESSKYIENVRRSLEIFQRINDQPAIQKGLAQLALGYGALANNCAAMEALERCMTRARSYWPGARQSWRNIDSAATILSAMGRQTAAAAFEQEALQVSVEEIKDPSFIYLSLTRLGTIYGRNREYDKALGFAQRGLDTGRSVPLERDRSAMAAFSLLQLGHIQRIAGKFSGALDQYDQAINLSDAGNLQVYLYEGHKGRLLCYLSLQNEPAIREELATTLDLFELCRSKITEETSRNTFFDQEQDVYDIAIDFEFSTMNNPEGAFEYSEKSRARSLLAMMSAPPRVSVLNNRPEIFIRPESERGDLQSLSKSDITKGCPPEVQVLQYAVLQNKVLMWVVSGDRFSPFKKDILVEELSEKVLNYLQQITQAPRGATSGELEAAAQLYQILIEPVASLLDPDKLICVVPDKFLNHLPFGALFSSAVGKRLIEMYPVMYSPSSTVFVLRSAEAKEKAVASERAVAIGNPAFDRRLFDLSPLQSAEREVRDLAKYYSPDSRVLTGKSATEDQVRSEMQMSDIIHFATHYIINHKYPQLSGLLLAAPSPKKGDSDGVLRSYEISGLDLHRAHVVVLASCQTGIDRYFKGEGAIGFSRAFIAAGVPVVVATLWEVESKATTALMLDFHEYRKRYGLSSVDALRNAQRDMIADSEHHRDHPFYWASFAVIGGYAKKF